jgi:hypothetical protein
MGLDIYHIKASSDNSKEHFVVNDREPLLSLQHLIAKKDNQYINWEQIFRDNDLDLNRYFLRAQQFPVECYGFVYAEHAGHSAPLQVCVWFYGSNLPLVETLYKFRHIFPAKIHGHELARGVRKIWTRRKWKTVNQDVLFGDVIGYQRGGVDDAFYQHFRPDEFFSDKTRFAQLIASILPDCRAEFRKSFIETWDDKTCAIIISY